MRRGYLSKRHGLAACLLTLVASCGPPQLTVVLTRAPDLPPPPNVRFELVTAAGALEEGPFSVESIPNEIFTKIPPDTLFYIDVIGCQTDEKASCEVAADFIARGCTPTPISIERDGDPVSVIIQLKRPDVGANECPPTLP